MITQFHFSVVRGKVLCTIIQPNGQNMNVEFANSEFNNYVSACVDIRNRRRTSVSVVAIGKD